MEKEPLSLTQRWILVGIAIMLCLGVASKVVSPLPSLLDMPLPGWRPVQLALAIALESCLALLLLFRPTRRTILITTGLLGGFCVWLLYLLIRGARSCGCFDGLGIHRSPALALVTNAVAILALLWICRRWKRNLPVKPELVLLACLLMGSTAYAQWATRGPVNPSLVKLLGNRMEGKEVILKISPSCGHCLTYTTGVLQLVKPEMVVAVTVLDDQEAASHYTQRFSIPVLRIEPRDFLAIDGRLDVPIGYWIRQDRLEPLPVTP